jgi:hypothetical protein
MKTSEAIEILESLLDYCFDKDFEALTHAIEVMRRSEAALTPPVVDLEALKRKAVSAMENFKSEGGSWEACELIWEVIDHLHAQGYLNAKREGFVMVRLKDLSNLIDVIQSYHSDDAEFCHNLEKDYARIIKAAQEGAKDE